jgi:coenzyme Q-binding protein COQ10
MPTIHVHELLQAPIEKVWDVVCDVEGYPQRMEPVRNIDVLESGDTFTVASWEVELKGSILKWVEREERETDKYRVTYEQVDGDLERFDGYWQLRAEGPDVTDAELVVNFDIGIPMLKDMLEPVAERAIRENASRMLLSLGARVDEA